MNTTKKRDPLRHLGDVLEFLAIIAMLVVAAIVFLQIVLRNLVAMVPVWLDEGARLAHIIMVYFTVPVLFRQGSHLAVDTFVKGLPGRLRTFAEFAAVLGSFVFALFFLYSGYDLMWAKGVWTVPTPAIRMSSLLLYLGPLLGFVFSAVFLVERVFAILAGQREE